MILQIAERLVWLPYVPIMVCNFIARIRQYAFTDQKGTNILGLIEAANKLGLSAKGVRAKFEALYIVPKPVIAHVIVHEQFPAFCSDI